MTSTTATTADGATADLEEERPADATRISRLAQRDGAIALAALSLWAAADAWQASTGLRFAALLATLDGAAVGVVLGLFAHEWGHFAGARWGGGIAPTRPLSSFLPIFVMDLRRSSRRAFRAMSVGGNLSHWLVVLALAIGLPLDTGGRVALLAGAFGFAVFASVTEFPIIRRAYAGVSPGKCFKGLTKEKLQRNRWIGAAAAALLFLAM
jgi:hypothetical protein